MSITALITSGALLAARTPLPQAGVFDWIRDTSNEIILTAIVVCAAATVIASIVVFFKSRFSLGATIMTAITGAIVTFLVAGGINWLATTVRDTV